MMADTTKLVNVNSYVISEMENLLNVKLTAKEVQVGVRKNGEARFKKFDGVSNDNSIIVDVANNSGKTSGGRKPSGKINSVLANCYYLNLTGAKKKILVLTNKEFFDIFRDETDGILGDIKLKYFSLPDDLSDLRNQVSKAASEEMS